MAIPLNNYYNKIAYIDSQGEQKYIYPSNMLAIDDITDMGRLANNYFLVANLCEITNRKLKALQKNLDEVISDLTLKYSFDEQLRKDNGGRKPTKDLIDSCVHLDNKYKEIKDKVINAQSQYNVLNSLLKALIMKKDLMQTLNSNARQEKSMTSASGLSKISPNQF